MYKRLEEYLNVLKKEYQLIISIDYMSLSNIVLFDINNSNSSFSNSYGINIVYNSIKGKEGFELNLPSKQLKEEEFSGFNEKLKISMDIVTKLNKFLDFYFL